ncbi:SIMPL domain-containing protein [Altericroceibacterium endophyticum]|uniref:DUF541 domain-containing protein n=1 Tax=Altericroceibacterium endophyticum TaxID=1808508 RepID=A0A6I4T2U6_9SPHN|nr:SIMPL domain-containing protein [Altericroceibacterium endophyticum]MXO64320.1 DUF541 domain-containing protein [Altericroceibacterium endophyticum]
MTRFAIPVLSLAAMTAAIGTPAMAAEVQVQAAGPVIELSVQESVKAEPDIVTMGAGVTSEAMTAVEAMRKNSRAMSSVVERIKSLGIAERDIQTTGINLNARYDYDQAEGKQVFRGYQASNRVQITLRDIDETGPVLDALVAAGANNLDGPNWSLEDDEAAKAQARKAALDTAKSQAMEYARWAGYTGVRLLEISENIQRNSPQPMAIRQAGAVMMDKATPVQPGMVESRVSVQVKFEMTR